MRWGNLSYGGGGTYFTKGPPSRYGKEAERNSKRVTYRVSVTVPVKVSRSPLSLMPLNTYT